MTVGVYESFTDKVATSPQDVTFSSRATTAAGGGRPLQGRSVTRVSAYAPGTVGATPGSTYGR